MSLAQETTTTENVRVLVGSDMFGYTLYSGGSRIYVYREALPALLEQLGQFMITQSFDPEVIQRVADVFIGSALDARSAGE